MNMNSNKSEIDNFFASLFCEHQKNDEYHFEGAKIEIAEQISQIMKNKNINQSELARKLDVNRAYVSRILNGNVNLTLDTLVKIGRKLDSEWTFKLAQHTENREFVFRISGWENSKESAFQVISTRHAENSCNEHVQIFSIVTGDVIYKTERITDMFTGTA